MNETNAVSVDDFRKGMQCLASGVCIVATGHGDQRNGFTATAVMSLSDQPPSLVVGVGKLNRSHDQMRQTGKFSVNVLRSDQRSEEHTSELQSLMRTSYAVFCLKTHTTKTNQQNTR